jgi:hypothetical protein
MFEQDLPQFGRILWFGGAGSADTAGIGSWPLAFGAAALTCGMMP